MMTKLDKLNKLLASRDLDLPQHRRVVDVSGGNLNWLKKHLHSRNTVPEELDVLLNHSIQDLVKPDTIQPNA